MNITELSNNIDQKLKVIDHQLDVLHQRKAQDANADSLRREIDTLEQLKHKLKQSKNIAWRAHELQKGNDEKALRQKRWLGLGLILFSCTGLLIIAYIVLTR